MESAAEARGYAIMGVGAKVCAEGGGRAAGRADRVDARATATVKQSQERKKAGPFRISRARVQ